MTVQETARAGERLAPTPSMALCLTLAAAAVVAVCAAHAGLDRATIAWRALAALISVASFQWSATEIWKIAAEDTIPAAVPSRPAKGARERLR